jgi:hypothetical protein
VMMWMKKTHEVKCMSCSLSTPTPIKFDVPGNVVGGKLELTSTCGSDAMHSSWKMSSTMKQVLSNRCKIQCKSVVRPSLYG